MNDDVLPLEQDPEIRELIARALAEDVGSGDATTLALVDADATASARIVARHPVVVAGMGVAGAATMWEAVFADIGVALIAVFNSMRALR